MVDSSEVFVSATHRVTLDWPSQGASMNSRKNWRSKHALQKKMKHDAMMLCRDLPECTMTGNIPVRITFYPPDKRRRDADNLLSSIKTALDAIAEQIGSDDSNFWPLTLDKGEKVKNGKVEIDLFYA